MMNIKELNKLHKEILNIYSYGSRVYGTYSEHSDYDYIIVIKGTKGIKSDYNLGRSDYHFYDEKSFQDAINNHEINVLECLSLKYHNNQIFSENKEFDYIIDLQKLRHSISKTSSNSFVKAKKKLTIEKDYDLYISKKSLFHSLRILIFGIQLAKYGKIINYTEANKYYEDIMNTENYDWAYYKETYQPIYNELSSKFKLVAPK